MDYRKFFRDYLEYYPSEKKGVFLLSLLIILWIIGLFIYTRIPLKVEDDVAFEEAVKAYYAAQALEERDAEVHKTAVPEIRTWNLFPFNPNTLSKDSLQMLGLSEKVASNISKYRQSGGQFKSPEDLSRIYSLSDSDFQTVKPFIRIPDRAETHPQRSSPGADFEEEATASHFTAPEFKKDIVVELNTADTAELKQIYGVGSYFAREIVERRIALGGYLYLDQLLEIWNLDSAKLNAIAPHLTLNKDLVNKININTISIDELRKHPYFPYTLANSLVRVREAHGPYPSVEAVKKSHLVTDSVYQRIKPYLTVNE